MTTLYFTSHCVTRQDRRPGTTQEGQSSELAQCFDSRSPVHPGLPADEALSVSLSVCLSVCTPTGQTRSQFGQSGLSHSQSGPREADWNLWEMRKPRSGGGGWPDWVRSEGRELRNVCFSPNLLSPHGSNTKYKEMVCKFYRIKPQRRLN